MPQLRCGNGTKPNKLKNTEPVFIMRVFNWMIALLALPLVFQSCRSGNSYAAMVDREVKSGKRVDDIFFDIKFGMTSKEFYLYCWNMNKKGVFTDGLNNQYVLYKPKQGDLKHPASMNFYPDFSNGRITGMRVLYQYDEWAPWNKKLFSDSLLKDVLNLYERMYPDGNSFMAIRNEQRGDIYVKVDGNRRITIGQFNDMVVKAVFTDLRAEKEGSN